MKKITSTISYRVPAGVKCNLVDPFGRMTETKCRFCQKHKNGYTCLVTNDVLLSEGASVLKTQRCRMAAAGFISEDTIDTDEYVDPSVIVKATLKVYERRLKALLASGTDIEVALEVAKEVLKK